MPRVGIRVSKPQLELNIRTHLWGGKRHGAGRPKKVGGHDSPHRAREPITASTPVHVVLRTKRDVGRLRRRSVYRAIHRAMKRALDNPTFRIVHASIQRNHLHLIVEAEHGAALADGMQAFTTTVAKTINRIQRHRGKVFAYRYHSTDLTSPRQVRNCIAYVLNNWRRHDEDLGTTKLLDQYASGVSFDGWRDHTRFLIPHWHDPLPVSAPRSWLLARGWREHHPLIRVTEVPGPLR